MDELALPVHGELQELAQSGGFDDLIPSPECATSSSYSFIGQRLPKYLSSDHDPLYRFHQWQANLRVLEVREIKTVPYVPLSHPFVERLIGTVRREYLDRVLF